MSRRAAQMRQALSQLSNTQGGSTLEASVMRVRLRGLGLHGAVPVSQAWASLGQLTESAKLVTPSMRLMPLALDHLRPRSSSRSLTTRGRLCVPALVCTATGIPSL